MGTGKDEAKKTVWNSSLEPHSEHFPRCRTSGILHAIHQQKDSGAARKWSCNRKTGNPLRKTGSGRSSEKVEELHPPVEEEKEEEDVIDIEAKPEITFDDFGKMQFQVGEIIACEEVKKSRKLLCSQVKIGSQVKQIVSGIKGHYTAEEMVGKKVMVLDESETCKTGRRIIRRNAVMRRRCRRQPLH